MNIDRKMATVEVVAEVKAIPDADKIQAYRIKDWWVVDSVGKYQVNDRVVYCEVDGFIPTEIAPFLSKGKEPKEFEGVKGERLRTVRLKKQVSQGLLLPISIVEGAVPNPHQRVQEGDDVSALLGIVKWEAPIPACLAGAVRGNLPEGIIKTDQTRVQNIGRHLPEYYGMKFEKTEKLHGSSCTMYLDMSEEFHVCSRNLDLKFDENNSFWKAAVMYDVEKKMRDLGLLGLAIQGELIGAGINGNQYKVDLEFRVFDMYNVLTKRYLNSYERRTLTESLGLLHSPVMQYVTLSEEHSVEALLKSAEFASAMNGSTAEGFVLKSVDKPEISFKVVSQSWLLKNE
jgi:RNA ligase (TIGR02306 family)